MAAVDCRRAFISGFDGSAGLAVVTADQAMLWTDGRYWLQAEQQLDHNWTLMRSGRPVVYKNLKASHLDLQNVSPLSCFVLLILLSLKTKVNPKCRRMPSG